MIGANKIIGWLKTIVLPQATQSSDGTGRLLIYLSFDHFSLFKAGKCRFACFFTDDGIKASTFWHSFVATALVSDLGLAYGSQNAPFE